MIRIRYNLQNCNGNTLIAITGHDMQQYTWMEEDMEIFLSIIRDLGNCCDIRFKKATKCSCLQAEMRLSRGRGRTRNNAKLFKPEMEKRNSDSSMAATLEINLLKFRTSFFIRF